MINQVTAEKLNEVKTVLNCTIIHTSCNSGKQKQQTLFLNIACEFETLNNTQNKALAKVLKYVF